jgi:hypothetical protein
MTTVTRWSYEDLHVNPETLRVARDYWERLTAAIADSLGQAGQWRQWIAQAYVDGRPYELEDQDTWGGRSDRLDRAYRIHQGPPVRDRPPGLAAWVDQYEEEYEEMPRAMLTIGLVLSDETARLAEKLLRKWMTPETTVEEMEAFIEEHAPERPPSEPGE